MLLEAEGLTRYYGNFLAVNDVSFQLQRGDIVGLLGPNGAGKSTTMRMLASFLPPSSGTITVAGCDVQKQPLEVRHHIGYLPENNPIYGEMRCVEYLNFRAQLKGLPRRIRTDRVEQCMTVCGVSDVRRQIVETLSKGYQQRLGLADALLGNPDVLILDEPTIGLDPNQIRQTRRMIANLGKDHAVLLSTHILQEVEAVCERALIIDRGQIIVDESVDNLYGRIKAQPVHAEIKGPPESVRCTILDIDSVADISLSVEESWCKCTVTPKTQHDLREDIFDAVTSNNWTLRELRLQPAKLEDVFHRLTNNNSDSGE